MIYIVEVLERMLTLAASRLSMMALEREAGALGAWMESEEADMEREERKINHQPPAVYQSRHETEPFIMAAAGNDFYALNSEKDSKLRFLLLLG